ncbi:MAG: hemolysin family protein [Thermoflexibacter sp.]|jgi:CBS domain containing-hemolysin-like protein|nr:hemolysin family protein [Thermoflexibacter sp.]
MSIATIIIILSLAFSAFFSGVELAFVSANRLHVALQKKKGKLWAEIIAKLIDKPSLFVTSMLVGNTISLTVYSIYMAQIFDPYIKSFINTYVELPQGPRDTLTLVAQALYSTTIVLAVAEFLPKAISLINPERLLAVLAVPIQFIYKSLYPFVYIILSTCRFVITNILKMEYVEAKPVFGLTDLTHYIHNLSSNENNKTEVDAKIFSNALEFKSIKVRECMIPRTEIIGVDKADGLEKVKQVMTETSHSKVIIYEETIDNIVGYIHALEFFKKPDTIDSILTPIIIVPETMLANELMLDFINEHKSMALVVDEFGGTSGIVTIEDLIEEIFGEIHDEYDTENDSVQKIDEDNFILNARLEIDYLNDIYKWEIPEGDYDTLGGYIISITENIPQIDEIVETPKFIFTIISMQDARIDKVKLTIRQAEMD